MPERLNALHKCRKTDDPLLKTMQRVYKKTLQYAERHRAPYQGRHRDRPLHVGLPDYGEERNAGRP